jgi:hypothetical protein
VSATPSALHLPSSADEILGPPVIGPRHPKQIPADFLVTVRSIASTAEPAPSAPPFRFQLTEEAKNHNTAVLARYNYDLEEVFKAHCPGCALCPGSEFRPPERLEPLLQHHPHWPIFRRILTQGATFPLKSPLPDKDRKAENRRMLQRGNHKSAELHAEPLQQGIVGEVRHGFCLPINKNIVNEIPFAMVAPLGVATQTTVSETGDRIPKYRTLHDMTYSTNPPTTKSLNDLADPTGLPEMVFGHTLSRTIHQVLSLRLHFPHSRILLWKGDYKSAYRRITHGGLQQLSP